MLAARAQAHLDPLVLGVEQGDVVEVLGVEVGVELAVEDAQDVAVELGGDALLVVVGGLQHARVLDQVGAHQQVVVGAEQAADRAQEATAAAGLEVADGAAEERDDPRPDRRGHAVEVALEVADHAVHAQAGVLLGERLRAVAHHALGHVDRHVALQRAGGVQRVEQHARLRGRARAELDELDGARQRRQLGRGLLEDRALGARGVVLGQLADPVEQLGAARVVEVLGRQFLERPREAVEHVLGERAFLAAVEVRVDPDRLLGVVIGSIRLPRSPAPSAARCRFACVASCRAVPRQAHAGEDLPALGQVPVAEGQARDAGMRRPRAAAQHAVVLAEEHLGVLAVGVGAEAGVAVERAARPLPHRDRSPPSPWSRRVLAPVQARRPLPLGLGGQARVVRSGEGVGLEPGDVADGRLGMRPPRSADDG